MCRGPPDCQPDVVRFIAFRMSNSEKQARLAEALRANLRRRKAQAREVRTIDDSGETAQPSRTDSRPVDNATES